MEIREYKNYHEEEILDLYARVGWTNYTDDPQMLRRAYENALLTLGAYEDGKLIGIIRTVGDGASIVYIQDIIVHPAHQRKGIGTQLMQAALARFTDVYQTVLATDDTEKTKAFYRSLGFVEMSELGCCAFMRVR